MSDIELLEPEEPKRNEIAERHSMEVMSQWANGEVYDEKVFIERGRMKFQEAQDAFFEFGRILVVLKEHMPHGYFQETVQREFNIAPVSARRMIQATVKFCSPELLKSAPKLIALGKSKLFELMSEDDDDLAALAEGETVNGLTLDDIDRMTRNELRAALKEAREDVDAARKVSGDKTAKIDELNEQLIRARRKTKALDPVDVAEELRLKLGAKEVAAMSEVYQMRQVCDELIAHGQAHGMDHTPAMVGSINQIIRAAESLRETFALPREAPTDEIPAWVKAVQAEQAEAANPSDQA